MRLLRNFGIIAASKSGGAIEPGLIVEYFGASNTIPEGWALCDGTNDTPDLRAKFIIGAGDTYSIGNTGGSVNAIVPSHTHTANNTNTVGNHTHNFVIGRQHNLNLNNFSGRDNPGAVQAFSITTHAGGAHSHSTTVTTTGSSGTNANLPPYHGLFYIIKEEN